MMNVKETADFLCVSERQVRIMANRPDGHPQKLPSYRVGTRLVFDKEEVQAFLRSRCKG